MIFSSRDMAITGAVRRVRNLAFLVLAFSTAPGLAAERCTGDIIGKWKNVASDNEAFFGSDCRVNGTECDYEGELLNSSIGQSGVVLVKFHASNGKEDGRGGKCLAPGTHPCSYEIYLHKSPLEAKVKCGTDEARMLVKLP